MANNYIARDSLLEKLQTTSIVTDDLYGMGIMSGMDAARKIVAEQPVIDAEPVVRCQHCKHHDEGENYIYCWLLKTKCPKTFQSSPSSSRFSSAA